MLVLSRKKGEKIVLTCGDSRIVVTTIETRGKYLRIGFDAPQEVKIVRQELEHEKESAA